MNLKELQEKLIILGVKEYWYSLKGGLPSESFCISKKTLWWEIYYSERGQKSNLKKFIFEKEACMFLYNLIISSNVIMNDLNKP
jgi:hypothetical protein